jgi:hypothetical protein
MGYTVTIRNNATGEICTDHNTFDFHGFWWSQNGNMGADCNRAMIFSRQFHCMEMAEEDVPYTQGQYDVTKIVMDSGEDVTHTVDDLNH